MRSVKFKSNLVKGVTITHDDGERTWIEEGTEVLVLGESIDNKTCIVYFSQFNESKVLPSEDVMLGKEEVFEGVVKLGYVDVFDFGDILSDDGVAFTQSLVKHVDKRVKVTLEFLT